MRRGPGAFILLIEIGTRNDRVAVGQYRKYLVGAAQAIVSVGVLTALAIWVGLPESMASIMAIPPGVMILAATIVALGYIAGALRWGMLLRNSKITQSSWALISYYFIGLFFSAFLPTGIGGDAFRVYAVARSSGNALAALFATLQERALGLCGSIAVSLAVMPAAGYLLPREVLPSIVAMQFAAVAALPFVLFPSLFFVAWRRLSGRFGGMSGILSRVRSVRMVARNERTLAGMGDLMRARPANVAALLLLGILPAVIISFSYQVVLASMGVDASPAFLMLIIPIVWIVRLLPISLGGIGVGEGAFVLLAGFAGIQHDKALAAAVAVLAVQLCWALFGGLLLLGGGLRKAFIRTRLA